MTPVDAVVVLSGGFMAGVLASAHCIIMCGGIAVIAAQQKLGLWPHLVRITTYITLALVAGSIIEDWIQFPRWILGVALVGAGLYSWRKQTRGGQNKSHHCADSCPRKASNQSSKLVWLWGVLPCPMVFMMLASTVALDPVEGGLLMAGFGIGTLPGLLSVSYGARWTLNRLSLSRPWFQAGLVAVGTWVILLETLPVHSIFSAHHTQHTHQNHQHH